MPDALIGHTGFVGGNLAAQHRFHACFNSKNIEAIRGQRFEVLVISAMPAAMWIANRDPAVDLAVLDQIWSCISTCRADTVVVMSTVAVYPEAVGVDEDSRINPAAQTAYGRHRLMLEERVAGHFPRVLVVRLPGLYGDGLKKNAIYDLLHDHETHKIPAAATYQFYNLARVWRDIHTALDAGLSLVNFATEPVSVREVAREAFGKEFDNDPGTIPARYDMRTRHAATFGGRDGYLESRAEVLAGVKTFVATIRARLRQGVAA